MFDSVVEKNGETVLKNSVSGATFPVFSTAKLIPLVSDLLARHGDAPFPLTDVRHLDSTPDWNNYVMVGIDRVDFRLVRITEEDGSYVVYSGTDADSLDEETYTKHGTFGSLNDAVDFAESRFDFGSRLPYSRTPRATARPFSGGGALEIPRGATSRKLTVDASASLDVHMRNLLAIKDAVEDEGAALITGSWEDLSVRGIERPNGINYDRDIDALKDKLERKRARERELANADGGMNWGRLALLAIAVLPLLGGGVSLTALLFGFDLTGFLPF